MVILGKVELRETQIFAGESYDLLPNIRRVEKGMDGLKQLWVSSH